MPTLTRFVLAHRRAVLALAVVFVAGAGAFAWDTERHLSSGGYEIADSESTLVASELADRFGTGAPNLVVLVDSDRPGGVDDPAVVAGAATLVDDLRADPAVVDVADHWSTGSPALRSADGSQALVVGRLLGDEDITYAHAEAIRDRHAGELPAALGTTVSVGGTAAMNLDIVEQSKRDLLRAELIVLPITALLLVFVFRSVGAALLPLPVAAVAVLGTSLGLRLLSEVTLVSIFALNLTTALGLGMAIDYSLFIITRYRSERAGGADTDTAIGTAMATAGRSALFSGLTTAGSLAALLLFPLPLMRSLAYAGFVVVLLSVVGAVVVLPAVLSVAGDRVDWLSLPLRAVPHERGGWYRFAHRVMRRPVVVIALVLVVLAAASSPFAGVRFGMPDDRVLPASAEARQVADAVRAGFAANEFGALAVVADGVTSDAEVAALADRLATLPGAVRVDSATGSHADGSSVAPPGPGADERFRADGASWYSVVGDFEPASPDGVDLVNAIRDLDTPGDLRVGGESARLADNAAGVADALPAVIGTVVVVVMVLLFVAFGSLLVPIKALVLNALSLTVMFGAIVWIFQDGNLSGALGFTATGLTDLQTPAIMLCIAFGLSMDYEVFLIARVKEHRDRLLTSAAPGVDVEREAAARGLQETGRLITSAAALMAVVFLSFATGEVTFIKLVGIGVALAVLVDATVVRATLVPAFLALAGRANWWAPGWLRRLAPGVEVEPPEPPEPPTSAPGPSRRREVAAAAR